MGERVKFKKRVGELIMFLVRTTIHDEERINQSNFSFI